jgi:hypothetical protein
LEYWREEIAKSLDAFEYYLGSQVSGVNVARSEFFPSERRRYRRIVQHITVLHYLDIHGRARMKSSSSFNETSFTDSNETARAGLSVGVNSRGTPGTS